MKIRYCPNCAQLVHFEPEYPVMRCWNCDAVSDFSRFPTAEERLMARAAELLKMPLPSISRLARAGKIACVLAVPLAAAMLLLCNSFNITVVHDPTQPFLIIYPP